ncbi:hypothetical protein SAMN05518866_11812 [Sphingobium sp. YR768]|nr:hypothetical protein SAMN05518866_11812 [Sphingobium sp. YR768]
MDILQKNFPRIGFDLERHKTGIILAAQAPIVADPVNGRYVYRIARLGGGWFLDFFKTVNGHRRGVFDEHELSGFTMLASDGNYLPYEKAPIESCQDARS